ncbi:MAG: Fur family transcriptional regulator [Candidatus Promineifilaceae bacterium]|jgi:Fur family ferric uptake transcriptional regulator
MNEQTERLVSSLVDGGYRLTPARQAIIDTLVASHGHITADDLAALVHESAPQVGRMTVYRTLELLCDLGLVRPIYQGTGAAHYVLLTDGSHHHLICTNCHRVFEFERCGADDLAQALESQFNFQVQSHLLEIYGLCEECRE